MMKINRIVRIFIMAVLIGTLFTGCSKNKQVILIPPQLDNGDYWDDIDQKLKKSAEEAGYSYNLMGSDKWDAKEQGAVIEEAIKSKPQAIVLGPIVSKDLYPSLTKAQEAGIPIILIDADMDRELLASDNIKVSTFVGIDNYQCGKDIADKMAEKLDKNSEVAVLRGGTDSANGEKRCDGFSDEISKKGMKVVADITTDWSDNDGYEKAKLVLKANPDLKAVFAVNFSVCKGAQKAADEADTKLVYGTFDSNDDVLKGIKEGSIECTLDQNSENMTKTIMDVVNKLSKGEKVEDITTSEGKLITKNNL